MILYFLTVNKVYKKTNTFLFEPKAFSLVINNWSWIHSYIF